ncbi:hypothetical protein, partial [Enterococcus faecium]|uniref:hypothetical protein n=1 Tax=Enterococcus faecium TaxID=1352 RepID=UPI001C611D71
LAHVKKGNGKTHSSIGFPLHKKFILISKSLLINHFFSFKMVFIFREITHYSIAFSLKINTC